MIPSYNRTEILDTSLYMKLTLLYMYFKKFIKNNKGK